EQALELTARHCGEQLERYGRCVAARPQSWPSECHALRVGIAQCASAHPIVRQIRQDCAEPFAAFERCLREHPGTASLCHRHAEAFLLCAHRV
ncbi:CHCH5 protein, partial [Grallaria varia]|nr:CHCH5 protein [Grallaria varia]